MMRVVLFLSLVVSGFVIGVEAAPQAKKSARRAINLDLPRDQVIAAALYTEHDHTLNLNAQLFPLVRLEVTLP